jgi:hypothetical protein
LATAAKEACTRPVVVVDQVAIWSNRHAYLHPPSAQVIRPVNALPAAPMSSAINPRPFRRPRSARAVTFGDVPQSACGFGHAR